MEEKRRLEARISELEDELEDENTNAELAADKARKAVLAVGQSTSLLFCLIVAVHVCFWGNGR